MFNARRISFFVVVVAAALGFALRRTREEAPRPQPQPEAAPSVASQRAVSPKRVEAKTQSADPAIQIAWGAGAGALGRSAASESSPEAPMALAVARSGEVLVLDQINGRIARWDASGAPLPAWP